MARIRIIKSADSRFIRLSLNGEEHVVNAAEGGEADVPDRFLPMLGDSHVEFELVDGPASAEAGEGAGGKSGDAPAEPSAAAALAKENEELRLRETKDGGRTSLDPSEIPPRSPPGKPGVMEKKPARKRRAKKPA